MDLELDGRVALVVGGGGLIGRAVVDRLRAEGATTLVASRHIDEDGSDRTSIRLDGSDDESVARAMSRILEGYGRLDALVVTAAQSARTMDPSRSSEPAQVLAAVNAKAMVFLRLANAALPVMVGASYGRIVGVSGQNAFVTGNLAGSVRNAALIFAAKNLADSVAGTGVTVNTVSPGIVSESPAADVAPGAAGQSSPSQIAGLIAYLVSPLAGAISGESIAVGHRVRGIV